MESLGEAGVMFTYDVYKKSALRRPIFRGAGSR